MSPRATQPGRPPAGSLGCHSKEPRPVPPLLLLQGPPPAGLLLQRCCQAPGSRPRPPPAVRDLSYTGPGGCGPVPPPPPRGPLCQTPWQAGGRAGGRPRPWSPAAWSTSAPRCSRRTSAAASRSARSCCCTSASPEPSRTWRRTWGAWARRSTPSPAGWARATTGYH